MRILGIDPGSTRIGFGLIANKKGQQTLLKSGLLKITSSNKEKRLLELADSYKKLLEKEKPDLVAIEKLFFVKNIKTGLEVAQSRGTIIFLTAQENIPLVEYAPSEVKLNVTGSGSADKKAVAKMVKRILKTEKIKGPDDVFDALAIAITAANHVKFKSLTFSK